MRAGVVQCAHAARLLDGFDGLDGLRATASSRRFDLVYPTPASQIMGTELEAIFKHTQPEAVAASRLQRQRRDQRAAKALVKAILRRQFNRYGFM